MSAILNDRNVLFTSTKSLDALQDIDQILLDVRKIAGMLELIFVP